MQKKVRLKKVRLKEEECRYKFDYHFEKNDEKRYLTFASEVF